MLRGLKRRKCAKVGSELEPIDGLLASLMSQNRHQCDALLDLKLSLEKRENPGFCIETFFAISASARDIRQCMLLEQLRLILMTRICVEAHQLETGEVTYHRVNFKADNLHCFFKQFICCYHGVACCWQCPQNTVFNLAFVP